MAPARWPRPPSPPQGFGHRINDTAVTFTSRAPTQEGKRMSTTAAEPIAPPREWYQRPYVTGIAVHNVTAADVTTRSMDSGTIVVRLGSEASVFVDDLATLEAIVAKLAGEVDRMRGES